MYNGNKLAECRVQPVHRELDLKDSKQVNETNKVTFKNCNNIANEESEIEGLEKFDEEVGARTRSKTSNREKEKHAIDVHN